MSTISSWTLGGAVAAAVSLTLVACGGDHGAGVQANAGGTNGTDARGENAAGIAPSEAGLDRSDSSWPDAGSESPGVDLHVADASSDTHPQEGDAGDVGQGDPNRIVDLATSADAACVLLASGHVWCWGGNAFGQLGRGTFDLQAHPTPAIVPNLADVSSLSGGLGYVLCALKSSGTLWCWGLNDWNQLGHSNGGGAGPDAGGDITCGGVACRAMPSQVDGLGITVDVSIGSMHVCARDSQGTVRCWGRNDYGQLGHDPASDQFCYGAYRCSGTPTPMTVAPPAGSLSLGGFFACAGSGTTVSCWGSNAGSALGIAPWDTARHTAPVAISGLSDVIGVAAGDAFTCARTAAGTASCWGNNDHGQLGVGYSMGTLLYAAPQSLPLTLVDEMRGGRGFMCGHRTNKTVSCWGEARMGETAQMLPTGTVCSGDDCNPAPTQVANSDNATMVATGESYACMLKEDNSVWCWGNNRVGQLGFATTVDGICNGPICPVPTRVQGLPERGKPTGNDQ